jgi:hypothetical protein
LRSRPKVERNSSFARSRLAATLGQIFPRLVDVQIEHRHRRAKRVKPERDGSTKSIL